MTLLGVVFQSARDIVQAVLSSGIIADGSIPPEVQTSITKCSRVLATVRASSQFFKQVKCSSKLLPKHRSLTEAELIVWLGTAEIEPADLSKKLKTVPESLEDVMTVVLHVEDQLRYDQTEDSDDADALAGAAMSGQDSSVYNGCTQVRREKEALPSDSERSQDERLTEEVGDLCDILFESTIDPHPDAIVDNYMSTVRCLLVGMLLNMQYVEAMSTMITLASQARVKGFSALCSAPLRDCVLTLSAWLTKISTVCVLGASHSSNERTLPGWLCEVQSHCQVQSLSYTTFDPWQLMQSLPAAIVKVASQLRLIKIVRVPAQQTRRMVVSPVEGPAAARQDAWKEHADDKVSTVDQPTKKLRGQPQGPRMATKWSVTNPPIGMFEAAAAAPSSKKPSTRIRRSPCVGPLEAMDACQLQSLDDRPHSITEFQGLQICRAAPYPEDL
jgi:hypothetical protein